MADPLASLVGTVASLVDRFDRTFVRRWLLDMLGTDAEQVVAWDRMTG